MPFERPPRRISTQRERPIPGTARETTSTIAASRSPAGASIAWRMTGASGTEPGSHTSQQAPVGAGSERSPKWRRMPRRRQPSPSTHAHTERYWRQRTFVPSWVAAMHAASVWRSQTPTTRPTTRSGAEGAGWMTPARAM
jgi:hypothetical protein